MSWLQVLSAVVATSVATATVEPGPPVQPSDAETLALERERFERVTVPVTIQGQGPFRFMVDTGAQATVLSKELAARLQLTVRNPATLVAMASRQPIETTEVSDLTLGSRSFHIQVAPLVEGQNIGGADGILGLDSLQGQRVLMDFKANRISVADADEPGANRGYEIVVKARRRLGQLIIANATVDGVNTAVIVDTGAQSSIGNLALFNRLGRTRSMGQTQMTDINGGEMSGTIRGGAKLEIGRMVLNNLAVVFADAPPFEALGLGKEPALILGMRELRQFRRVAIDFEQRRVLFDLPPGADQSDKQGFVRRLS
jgi:predicted aspartyl protease